MTYELSDHDVWPNHIMAMQAEYEAVRDHEWSKLINFVSIAAQAAKAGDEKRSEEYRKASIKLGSSLRMFVLANKLLRAQRHYMRKSRFLLENKNTFIAGAEDIPPQIDRRPRSRANSPGRRARSYPSSTGAGDPDPAPSPLRPYVALGIDLFSIPAGPPTPLNQFFIFQLFL